MSADKEKYNKWKESVDNLRKLRAAIPASDASQFSIMAVNRDKLVVEGLQFIKRGYHGPTLASVMLSMWE